MTLISKNVFIDELEDIVNECNNTYHDTIKMKSVNVESSTNTDSRKEIDDKDLKLKTGDIVRISKYKNIFTKGFVPDCSE